MRFGHFALSNHFVASEAVEIFRKSTYRRQISQIAANLRSLQPTGKIGTLIFDYALSEDGLEFCSWLVQENEEVLFGRTRPAGNRPISAVARSSLAVSAKAMEYLSNGRSAEAELRRPPLGPGGPAPSLRPLADALLSPELQALLARGTLERLVILPAADIGSVPFAALPITPDERPLIEFVAPMIVGDLDALIGSPMGVRDPFANAVVIGDPDSTLRRAREEAHFVAQNVRGATLLLGSQATRAQVFEALSQKTFIYFASHALSHPQHPMDRSFLVLADGELHGTEIKTLFVPNSLVVMSACQTGLGKLFSGGTFGLTQAWYSAGAAQVIMSLWQINDGATEIIMKEFVRQMQDRQVPEIALQRAILFGRNKLYAESGKEDPALWSGLSIAGFPSW